MVCTVNSEDCQYGDSLVDYGCAYDFPSAEQVGIAWLVYKILVDQIVHKWHQANIPVNLNCDSAHMPSSFTLPLVHWSHAEACLLCVSVGSMDMTKAWSLPLAHIAMYRSSGKQRCPWGRPSPPPLQSQGWGELDRRKGMEAQATSCCE